MLASRGDGKFRGRSEKSNDSSGSPCNWPWNRVSSSCSPEMAFCASSGPDWSGLGLLIASSIWWIAFSSPLRLLSNLSQQMQVRVTLNKQTHFFTPFCRPKWWLGTMHSTLVCRHFSHRAWPGGRLQRILLRRQFRHAGCFPCGAVVDAELPAPASMSSLGRAFHADCSGTVRSVLHTRDSAMSLCPWWCRSPW